MPKPSNLDKMIRVAYEMHHKKGYYYRKWVKAMKAAATREMVPLAKRTRHK